MFSVGLTGGVASGKSTVAEVFAELGAGVVDTDAVAREVVAQGEPGLAAVRAAFGEAIITETGTLDRAALRRVIFQDPAQRRRLETILHPLIRARTLARLELITAPYALVVVPLLLETGFKELVDRVLVVDCPRSSQLRRLRERDGVSQREAEAMLSAQVDSNTRLAAADDIVDNGGDLEVTRQRVRNLHQDYLAMASRVADREHR